MAVPQLKSSLSVSFRSSNWFTDNGYWFWLRTHKERKKERKKVGIEGIKIGKEKETNC